MLVADLSMLDVSCFSIGAVDHQLSLNSLQLAILFAYPVFAGENEKEYRGYNTPLMMLVNDRLRLLV